jgi:RNA polymerase-binding protein DksA
MAVKKATPAAKKGVRAVKAASTRAGSKTPAKGAAKRATRVTTAAKATTSAKPPAKTAGKAPAKAAAKGPARAAAKAPAKAAAKAPAKAAAKGPAKAAAKGPAKAAAKPPAKAAAKPPAKAKAPAKAPAKPTPKTPATATATPKASSRASAQPQRLRVTQDEKPWTAKEFSGIRAELEADVARLRDEITTAEVDLAGLMRDVGDGAGDDPADAGTATFEREQEMSLANNAREVFEQSTRALARLAQGSYGICESCGNPIGKNRLLAFPRATLCLTCKSKQERR